MSPNSGMLRSNLQKHKYLSMISIFLHKTSEQGLFCEPVELSPNSVCYDQNLQQHISARYQYFCTKPSEQGSFFRASRMSPNSGMLLNSTGSQNKPCSEVLCRNIDIMLRYLLISIFQHETFRTGLVFPSWSK